MAVTAAARPSGVGADPSTAPVPAVAAVASWAVPVAIWVVHARQYGAWLVDDALITFAYVRTLTEGGGYAQQPGAAPVEGISNPLWAVLLAGVRLAGGFDRGHVWAGVDDTVVVVRVLALLLFVATLACCSAVCGALLHRPRDRWLAFGIAGIALASSPPYVIWSVSGLENPLYGFLVALLVAVMARARATGRIAASGVALRCGLLCVTLAATRPDGLVFLAAYPTVVLLRGRDVGRWAVLRAAAAYTAAAGVPLAALLAWRHAAFGLWVPNTAIAKGQQLAVPDLTRVVELVAAAGWGVVGIAVAAIAASILQRSGRTREPASRRAGPELVVPLTLSCLAYVVLTRDWMAEFRFATPVAVLGSVAVGVLVALAVASVPARRRGVAALVATSVALVVCVGAAIPRVREFAAQPTVPGCYVADRYGRTFNLYADRLGIEQGTLLLPDLGGTLLTTRLRVVDLAGLTDPTIAGLRGRRDGAGIRDHVLTVVRPTFVHTHRPWGAGLTLDPRFRRDYRRIVGGDYVRKDAAGAAAVRALRGDAMELDRRFTAARNQTRQGCGALRPGQVPTV